MCRARAMAQLGQAAIASDVSRASYAEGPEPVIDNVGMPGNLAIILLTHELTKVESQ